MPAGSNFWPLPFVPTTTVKSVIGIVVSPMALKFRIVTFLIFIVDRAALVRSTASGGPGRNLGLLRRNRKDLIHGCCFLDRTRGALILPNGLDGHQENYGRRPESTTAGLPLLDRIVAAWLCGPWHSRVVVRSPGGR